MQNQPLSREDQLLQQVGQLTQQLQGLMQQRANATILTVGEINDGLMFLLQAAATGDASSLTALHQIRTSLEKILKGDWSPSRIVIPKT